MKESKTMLKKVLCVVFLAAVFCAIAVSASQLATTPAAGTACGSPCTKSTFCVRPCFCYIPVEGGTSGLCQPEGPPPGPNDAAQTRDLKPGVPPVMDANASFSESA
jgi:hypothetical protein